MQLIYRFIIEDNYTYVYVLCAEVILDREDNEKNTRQNLSHLVAIIRAKLSKTDD